MQKFQVECSLHPKLVGTCSCMLKGHLTSMCHPCIDSVKSSWVQLSYTSCTGCLLCSSAGYGWGTHPLHRSVQPLQQICNLDLLGQGHDPLLVQISYCTWFHLESGRLLLAVSNVLTENCSLPLDTFNDLYTGGLCQHIQSKMLMILWRFTAVCASNTAADVATWQVCVMQGTRWQ